MKPAGLSEVTSVVVDVTAFIGAMSLLWFGCAVVLWWAYDMSAFVAGGAYSWSYALSCAVKFGFILSALIAAVWLRRRKRIDGVRPWRVAWTVWWQTAVVLFVYALIIVTRRELWTPQQDLNDWAMNARFFSEVGPLSFVLTALPCIASISSTLFLLLARFRATSRQSTT